MRTALTFPRRASVNRTTGVPTYCLQLEITESLAAQNEQIPLQLHELKATGIKLALDDFGTGYCECGTTGMALLPIIRKPLVQNAGVLLRRICRASSFCPIP
ncbi:MAG: EAL domain-containing protein [Herminiimonas sp.]|nr:EAL domain-containing protein [Herminiimonas sp.]